MRLKVVRYALVLNPSTSMTFPGYCSILLHALVLPILLANDALFRTQLRVFFHVLFCVPIRAIVIRAVLFRAVHFFLGGAVPGVGACSFLDATVGALERWWQWRWLLRFKFWG